MKRRQMPVIVLAIAALALTGCASGAQRREARRETQGEAFATSTMRDVKRAIGYRDPSDLLEELKSGSAAGFAFDFGVPVETVASAARQVLQDYGLNVVLDTTEGDRTFVVAETGLNERGLGELVGVAVSPQDPRLSHVVIVSRKKLEFVPLEKDWTSDILAGLKVRLESTASGKSLPSEGSASPATPEKPPEEWLAEVQTMVNEAFATVESPTLIVVCEGKEGGYLADRIISALGSAPKPVRIVASGRDLDLALQEQEKAVSGVYDQATTVQVGKLRGARYAFYGTPYVKRSENVVELSCKILDIESGDYLNAGRIVTLPLSELPED